MFQDKVREITIAAMGFAACAHRKQKRKYTGEPYFSHCKEVMEYVKAVTNNSDVICASLLHDVIEDTDVTAEELKELFGEAITSLVLEVTDVSRKTDGNRAARKNIDLEHLKKCSPEGATIKLADIISNAGTISIHAPDFAKIYLQEINELLPFLSHGSSLLYLQAKDVLEDAYKTIKKD